jgi:hypothetical protein
LKHLGANWAIETRGVSDTIAQQLTQKNLTFGLIVSEYGVGTIYVLTVYVIKQK